MATVEISVEDAYAVMFLREVESMGRAAPLPFRRIARAFEERLPGGVGPTLAVIDGTAIGPDGLVPA